MANADQRAMVLLHLLSQPVPVKIDFTEIKVSRAQIGGRTASKAPMATPNCSTVGQSNCSRQDGVIMRGLR